MIFNFYFIFSLMLLSLYNNHLLILYSEKYSSSSQIFLQLRDTLSSGGGVQDEDKAKGLEVGTK